MPKPGEGLSDKIYRKGQGKEHRDMQWLDDMYSLMKLGHKAKNDMCRDECGNCHICLQMGPVATCEYLKKAVLNNKDYHRNIRYDNSSYTAPLPRRRVRVLQDGTHKPRVKRGKKVTKWLRDRRAKQGLIIND